jgi:hypothetical protein
LAQRTFSNFNWPSGASLVPATIKPSSFLATSAGGIQASAAVTEDNDTISATAAVAVHGAASVTEAADAVAATGAVAIHANVAITEAADTEGETAAVAIHANANLAEAADVLSATGTTASGTGTNANLSVTEGDDTISAAFGKSNIVKSNQLTLADAATRQPPRRRTRKKEQQPVSALKDPFWVEGMPGWQRDVGGRSGGPSGVVPLPTAAKPQEIQANDNRKKAAAFLLLAA